MQSLLFLSDELGFTDLEVFIWLFLGVVLFGFLVLLFRVGFFFLFSD